MQNDFFSFFSYYDFKNQQLKSKIFRLIKHSPPTLGAHLHFMVVTLRTRTFLE